jgi:DNA-binding transcriptional MocR family regulator
MAQCGYADYEDFRRAALLATGVSFCTRLHFGRALPGERERYIRLSYSGIPEADIEEGLAALREFAQRAAEPHHRRQRIA